MKNNYLTSESDLVLTPIPLQTSTYKPISHRQAIDLTLEGIHKAGFQVDYSMYTSRNHGQVAFGQYFLKGIDDGEMQLQAFFQNSYDKSLALKAGLGGMVLVCTNGMIAMRSINEFRHKHLGNVQEVTPLILPEYFKDAGEVFQGLQGDRDRLKNIEVDRRAQSEIIGRMFMENEIITGAQLNLIKQQIKKPLHDYKSPNSLWELYNFTTYAIGGFSPNWVQEHIDANQFFLQVAEEIV